jgi:hypothetical protein
MKERQNVPKARARWCRQQGSIDPTRLVFLDESAAKTNMTRLRGRSQRGKRVHFACPHGQAEADSCRFLRSSRALNSLLNFLLIYVL